MATVRNVSSGALDVPVFNRVIMPDEIVQCTDDVAAGFEGQPDWQIEYDADRPPQQQAPADDDEEED